MNSIPDDVGSLHRCIRDLVALTTLPTIWAGNPPQAIAESLSDVVLTMLRLDMVYIRLNRPRGVAQTQPFEIARTPKIICSDEEAQKLGRAFTPYLVSGATNLTHPIRDPLAEGMLQIAVIPIGLNGVDGYIIAGAHASQALSDLDRLLLSVAANQAVTALQQAYLLSDLREAYAKEQAAHAEADLANQTKLKFLAMISHELRTPLTSIKGFASSLLSEDIKFSVEDQHEYLQIIDDEANKLAELIEQLLDLSRIQAGTMRITPETMSVKSLIEMTRIRLQVLAADHQLVIEMPDTPIALYIDAARIGQVLSNLVHNASKFAPPDSAITVRVIPCDGYIQVDVEDQGIGIPADERPRLFEAFRQVERTSHIQKGAGLGLAICKGLVEAHGGTIWIADQEPGTTISFTLPSPNEPFES
jgi:two-component system, OmpR family, sensor histidine kinase KdpD